MTSSLGPLLVIAQAEALEALPRLERALDVCDLEHRVEVADTPDIAPGLVAAALERGCRFLVVLGNDAAVQGAVNGIFDADGRPRRDDAVLGIVPWGTGCDLIKSFGLPDDVDAACRHLMGENLYPLDVMKVTATSDGGGRASRYAVNLAEVGMGAEVAHRLGVEPGRIRRFRSFWGGWLRSKPASVKVDADMTSWEGMAFNVIVGNGQFTGGLRMSPRSFPGDGFLDALVFHGPRSDAYTLLPRIFRHGDHVPDPNIKEMRAKIRIAVEATRPLPVVADGVVFGTTPVTFQVVPAQLSLKL